MFHILCRGKRLPPPQESQAKATTTTPATMASENTTYLISGTTRGIGKGLVQSLLQRPNTTIIAGVRDTTAPAALALHDLPKAQNSHLILVRLNSTSETDAEEAVKYIQKVCINSY